MRAGISFHFSIHPSQPLRPLRRNETAFRRFLVHIDLAHFYRIVVRPLLLLVLAAYFLFVAALVVVRYAVLPAIDDYRPRIERLVGRAVGAPVRIGRIDAEWLGLHPSFELSSVQVSDSSGQAALNLPKVSAILSWRSLLVLQPRFLRLQLEAPALEARRDAQGRYWLAGWEFDPRAQGGSRKGLDWLLTQREVVVTGGRLRWSDAQRAAPPLEIGNVSFVLRNTGRGHRAALRAEPPAQLGSMLDVRADFTHGWFTLDAADPRQWQGSLYASMDRVDLAGWRPWLELPGQPRQGTGAVRTWLDYGRGQVRAGTMQLALRDLSVQFGPALPPLDLARLAGRADLATGPDGGYRLDLSGVEASTGDGLALLPGRLTAAWTPGRQGQPPSTRIEANGFDLGTWLPLADRLPLPQDERRVLDEWRPAGRIEELQASWQGPPTRPSAMSGRARFSGLSIAAAPEPAVNDGNHPQRPGFSNLQGSVEIEAGAGRIDIDARDAVLRFPGVFAEPDLPMDALSARAAARKGGDGAWEVDLERLDFSRRGVQGSFSGKWSSRGRTEAGTLDLRGGLARADVREIYRYLPIVVGEDVRSWVRHALVAGRAEAVAVRARGDLDAFPYGTDKTGEFRVTGKLGGVTLDYLPESMAEGDVWPRLEGLAGDFVFDRVSMGVDVRSGRVRVDRSTTVALGRTRASIADLEHDPLLRIEGETHGAAPAYLAFVKRSPVGRMIDGALDEASATGNFVVPLSLRIPLASDDEVQVKGEVGLAGNDFALAPGVPPLSRLNGAVGFDQDGIALRNVTGTALGGPVSLSGGPQPDGSDVLRAEGTAEAAALTFWWDAPGMARLSGRAGYRASVRIEPGKMPTLLVESDLVGLAADLPAPLGKAAREARPSRLEWGGTNAAAGRPRTDWFAGSMGPAVNLHVERDFDAAGAVAAVRGAVGVHRAATINGPGLGVSASLPEVDVDRLRAVAAEFERPGADATAGAGQGAGLDLPLNRVSLSTPVLRVRGRQLDKVSLYAVRQDAGGNSSWRADIESAQMAGRLAWAETRGGAGPNRLSARLSRLVVDSETADQDRDRALDEAGTADRDVPEIDLVAEHFELFGKELGRLEVLAQSSDRGREWRLRRLHVKNPDAELDGTGVWKLDAGEKAEGRRAMSLDAVLKLANTGKFLERMGLHGTMAGGTGSMSAQISWRGLPYSLDLPSLSGKVELSLDKGQFLKAEPGIAKLLGVLSLQSLPRRVTLDFRDIFSEGFAYDTIRAHASIANGVAHTDDFKMNGVNATVVIAGDADLEHETQRLRVVVVPKLDAGAASLLYGLAVNPAVGLSVFLAQLLLKDPLSKVLAYQYEITGPWTDPHVAKVGSAKVDAADGASSPPAAQPPAAPNP